MKVGSEPDRDPERVRHARGVIGDGVRLFVDANGAYSRKQALALAERFAEEACPDLAVPGMGLAVREDEAERYEH
jgi:L-alanine-DL-glutamate epimerase-like enolase superfamily enzyme